MINKCGKLVFFCMILSYLSVNLAIGQQDIGKIKCVCIDAGHGGKDPGALGAKSREKNIVLAIALKLGKQIEKSYPDIKVVYVREKDEFVDLKERTRIANKSQADLFISIHANSLDIKRVPKNKSIKGIETFVLGTNNSEHNLQVAMLENAVIHYEDDYSLKYQGFDPSRAESYIMFSMLRNLHLDKSLILAAMIQEEVIASTQRVDREVRQGPFWVLKDVAMPAVLVEVGYMSNAEDERFLMSETGRAKIVNGIFKGFQTYKEKVEKKIAINQNALETKENTKPLPVFAIQVASAVKPIKNTTSICDGYQVRELNTGGRYRYYVAESSNLDVVKNQLKSIREKVNDCFIIAIYEGQLISVAEAKKYFP